MAAGLVGPGQNGAFRTLSAARAIALVAQASVLAKRINIPPPSWKQQKGLRAALIAGDGHAALRPHSLDNVRGINASGSHQFLWLARAWHFAHR